MLRGRGVIILPDNDEPGYQHAHQVARSLYGIAAAVRIVELPRLGPRLPKHCKDTSDWIAAGGTQEELKRLVLAAPEWTPDDDEPADAPEADALERVIPSPLAWPDPPNEAVYYGLAGEIVRALEPATEADPVALRVTLLTVVGNIVGAEPH
jgi:hypothetical protein